jgi:biopolymer transport protein ExbB
MKIIRYFLSLIFLLFLANVCYSKDARTIMRNIDKKKLEILKKAEDKLKQVKKEKNEIMQQILKDKTLLLKKISDLKKKKKELLLANKRLQDEIKILEDEKQRLISKFNEKNDNINELIGQIRINAKDLMSLIKQSPYSALTPGREDVLLPILEKKRFPEMKDIKQMVNLLFSEIVSSSEVTKTNTRFINRKGEKDKGEILLIGPFTSVYRTEKETGFLLYSDKSERFFALSKLPPSKIRKKLIAYLDGKSDDIYIDISKGGALRGLVHSLSFFELISKGGPLVWPIVGIGILAIILIIERFLYLFKCKLDEDIFMERIRKLALEDQWEKCINFCKENSKKPLCRVILNGIQNRTLSREDLENVLQESILNEIPKMERFLSTLGMFGAISPLLGLLGTVTGMINTFHVITIYGTGDPKMMSSGISEALVTTMLGLGVAIPIMLFHSIISKKVEDLIAKMEESAVSLVNIIFARRV